MKEYSGTNRLRNEHMSGRFPQAIIDQRFADFESSSSGSPVKAAFYELLLAGLCLPEWTGL